MPEQVQVSQKAIKIAYKLYEQKKFDTIGKLYKKGHYNKEFFVHFSVKQLAHMDDRNSPAGSSVPELMKATGFGYSEVVTLSAAMASNKMEGGKMGKAQNYLNVLMRFVEEYGTQKEIDRALQLRERLEFLLTPKNGNYSKSQGPVKAEKHYAEYDPEVCC
ncbi:Uncharacterised protein [uncultured archaeon]|nr:Uncharacterised protein [uncultured archaeon]